MMIRLTLLFAVIMIMGCGTEQGRPNQPHEQQTVRETGAPPSPKATWIEFLGARDSELSQLPNQEMRRLAFELADRVLDEDRLKSAVDRSDESLLAELTLLNRILLKMNADDPGYEDLLRRYFAVLGSGCGQSMRYCSHLWYFKKVPHASSVVEKMLSLKVLSQGREFTLFSLGFSLHNREVPSSLMLKFTEELQRQLRSPSEKSRGETDNWVHFASTLAFSSGRSLRQGELQNLVRAFAPLSTATRRRLSQVGAPLGPWLNLVAQSGLLRDKEYLAEVLKAEFQILDSSDESSLKRARFLKSRFAKEWNAFAMRDLVDQSLALWLVESVYSGSLSGESAKILWSGSGLPDEGLWVATEGVLRVQFLFTLLKGHEAAREKLLQTDVSSDELLRQTLEAGLAVRPLWTGYSRQIGQLKNFVMGSLKTSGSPKSIYQKALAVFNGVPREIKMMATYPHMIVAVYFFSKKDAEIRFRSPFGYVTVNSTEIMEEFFRGNLRPWFDYSDDSRKFNSFEIVSAFDAAVRAGLFTQFNIDPYEFVLEMHQRMTREPLNEVQIIHDQLKSRFGSSEFADFVRDCESLKSGGGRPSWSTPIAELNRYPLRGSSRVESIYQDLGSGGRSTHSDANAVVKATKGLFLMDELVAEGVEVQRLDLWMIHLLLNSMRTSVDAFSQSGFANKNKLALEVALRNEDHVGAQFMGLVGQVFERVKGCYHRIALDEVDASRRLAKMEIAYLQQVYRDLKRMRANGGFTPVQTPLRFSGLPGGFTGLDEVSPDGYWYHSSDVFLRLRYYMQNGLVTDSDRFDPVAPHVVVHLGDRLSSEHPLVRDAKKVFLSYTASEDQFVEQGIRTLFHSGDGWLRWYSTANSDALISWGGFIQSLVGLYRSGEVSLYPPKCLHDICGSESKVKRKIVKVDDLIGIHAEYLKLTQLNELDRRIMKTAGLFRKFDPMAFSNILLKYSKEVDTYGNINSLFGLFDYVIENGTQPALGRTLDALRLRSDAVEGDHMTSSLAERIIGRRKGFMDLGQDYYQFRVETLERAGLFGNSQDFLGQLHRQIMEFVGRELDHIGGLSQAVTVYAQSLDRNGMGIRADLSLAESIVSPVISQSVVQKSANQLGHFHRATGGIFKKSND